jgi:hypothetical protein
MKGVKEQQNESHSTNNFFTLPGTIAKFRLYMARSAKSSHDYFAINMINPNGSMNNPHGGLSNEAITGGFV